MRCPSLYPILSDTHLPMQHSCPLGRLVDMTLFFLRHKKITAILFFVALFSILWFSFTQSAPTMKVNTQDISFRLDYLLHALAYFVLMVLFVVWQFAWLSAAKRWIVVIALGVLLAAGTELGQMFLPTRSVNPYDLLANVGGLSLGVLISLTHIRRQALKMETK